MDQFQEQREALARIRGDSEPDGARAKAYREGKTAFYDPCLGFADNPYPSSDAYIHLAWSDGYNTAADEAAEAKETENGIV